MNFTVFCSNADSSDLPHSFACERPHVKGNTVTAWKLYQESEIDDVMEFICKDRVLERYLDCVYVLFPNNNSPLKQLMIDEIFESLACEYETLIDPKRNLQNISNLINAQRLHLGGLSGKTLVDFGCGTGLSYGVAHAMSVHTIGIERSPSMRNLARSRGMFVVDTEQSALLETPSFHGIIASYVLHLPIELDGLKVIWTGLKLGGALVANFHKNSGLSRVDSYFEDLGADVCTIDDPQADSIHGPQRKYVRRF